MDEGREHDAGPDRVHSDRSSTREEGLRLAGSRDVFRDRGDPVLQSCSQPLFEVGRRQPERPVVRDPAREERSVRVLRGNPPCRLGGMHARDADHVVERPLPNRVGRGADRPEDRPERGPDPHQAP